MLNWSKIGRGTLLGRLLRAPLGFVPPQLVVPILAGPARGMRWRVGSMDHGCWLGSYELQKQRALERHLRPGMTVWDVGANVGFYTLLFSRMVGDSGSVLAFEPFAANVAELLNHLRLNRITNTTVVNCALASTRRIGSFAIGASHAMGAVTNTNTTYRVPTCSPDEIVEREGLPAPDIVKMDVEGGEADVLAGARRLLERRRTLWFIATHSEDQKQVCQALLEDAGHRLFLLDGQQVAGSLCALKEDEFYAVPRGSGVA